MEAGKEMRGFSARLAQNAIPVEELFDKLFSEPRTQAPRNFDHVL